VPYLSASEVVFHQEALYRVYLPLPLLCYDVVGRVRWRALEYKKSYMSNSKSSSLGEWMSEEGLGASLNWSHLQKIDRLNSSRKQDENEKRWTFVVMMVVMVMVMMMLHSHVPLVQCFERPTACLFHRLAIGSLRPRVTVVHTWQPTVVISAVHVGTLFSLGMLCTAFSINSLKVYISIHVHNSPASFSPPDDIYSMHAPVT